MGGPYHLPDRDGVGLAIHPDDPLRMRRSTFFAIPISYTSTSFRLLVLSIKALEWGIPPPNIIIVFEEVEFISVEISLRLGLL